MSLNQNAVRGIIFDMDGVLINSEQVMNKAAILALAEFGIEAYPHDFIPYMGQGENSFIGNVARKYNHEYQYAMKYRAYEIYDELVSEEAIFFPKVKETIVEMRRRGYKIALASGADYVKVASNIRAIGMEEKDFQVIVTGNDVVKNKPEPDLFLIASERLKLNPAYCLVCEDTISGIKAAKSAKMQCIGITSSLQDEVLENTGADMTAKDISILLEIMPSLRR